MSGIDVQIDSCRTRAINAENQVNYVRAGGSGLWGTYWRFSMVRIKDRNNAPDLRARNTLVRGFIYFRSLV